MKIDHTCQNEECGHDFVVRFSPSTPNTGMAGRWEDSEQGSAAECDPCECPKCGCEIDADAVEEEMSYE
jgi:hypothetical protein